MLSIAVYLIQAIAAAVEPVTIFYNSSINAKQMILTGEFDNWSKSIPMSFNEKWFASLSLDRARDWEYKFIADGAWTLDPSAPVRNNNNLLARTRVDPPAPTTSAGYPPSIPEPSYPPVLPNCDTWQGKDSCTSGAQNRYPENVNDRMWQTAPNYNNQPYSDLTGWTSIDYSADLKSATITVNTFTRDPNAKLEFKFNNLPATTSKTFKLDSSFKDPVSVTVSIINTQTSLVLPGSA